ncbi:MAG: T9SS type A sorting domain-containing protein [Thermaurantimonas sp.]
MTRILTIAAFFLALFEINGQQWYEMIQNGERDFRKIRTSAEEYFKDINAQQRGVGYNVYKRWEYNALQSLDQDSMLPTINLAAEWDQYLRQNNRKSSQSTANWQPLGPISWSVMNNGYSPGLGRVNYIYMDTAHNNTLYLCTPSGGLWRSYDMGITYQVLTDHLASIGCGAVVVNPLDSNVLYLATGDNFGADTYSIGVLKSTDYGQTWNPTGLSYTQNQMIRIFRLLLHPQDTSMLLASTSQGIFRSVNGGNSWTLVHNLHARSLVYNPKNPNTVFAAHKQLIRSHDFGLTWTQVTDTIPPASEISRMEVAISPSDTSVVYALIGGADNGFLNLSRSLDGGNTFHVRSTTPNILHHDEQGIGTGGQAWYDLALAVDPLYPNTIFAGGINIWKSTNGGASFTIKSHWVYSNQNLPYVHADIHFLGFYNGTLYAGCDGGIFLATNGGGVWIDISEGLKITQVYRLGTSHTHPDIIHFGAQDNGSMRRFLSGSWHQAFGADGMETVIDYTNPNIAVISYQNGGLLLTVDGGNSFTPFMNGIDQLSGWITPFVIHPTDPQRWLVGRRSVWETYDRGISWGSISPADNVSIGALAWSKSDPLTIYFSKGNNLWKTTNGGANWSVVSQSLPFLNISSIAIHPNNPNHVVITYSSFFPNQKVYQTLNGGTSWTNISGNLPNLQAWSVIFHEGNPLNAMYLGMGIGVYYRDSTMSQWEPYFEGLPNVPVRELEINYTSNMLYAATYGRGVWKSDLKSSSINLDEFAPTQLDVFVYPNPFYQDVKLRNNKPGLVEVADLSGRILFQKSVSGPESLLHLGPLAAGIYVLKFTADDGQRFTQKIMCRGN